MTTASSSTKLRYPPARHDGTTYALHGVEIEDPYRHLENAFAQETKEFVGAQNKLTDEYLSAFLHSAALQQMLEQHSTFPLVSDFVRAGERYFWRSNPNGLPQPVWRQCAADAIDLSTFTGEEGDVFFDVNSLSREGDSASEDWGKWSPSGRFWATLISHGGSDWQTVYIVDCVTGKQVDAELQDVKFCWTIEWLGDEAFIYKRLEHKHKDDTSAEGGFASVIHRLGTNQAEDTYLWSDPANPQHSVLIPRVTDDGRHLLFDIFGSTDPVTRLLATEAPGLASRADPSFRDVNENWDGSYYYICTTAAGRSLFNSSRRGAARKCIVSTDLSDMTKPTRWEIVVPEHEKAVLQREVVALSQGLLLLVYSIDVGHEVWLYKDSGEPIRRVSDAELPWSAMIKEVRRGKHAAEFSVECWSYIAPPTVYRGVVKDGDVTFSVLHTASVAGWREADYIQKQVFYPSKNGTLIPMHIAHSRSLDLSKPHPTLLFGYGGFAWTQEPRWDALFSTWLQSFQGVLAVAGIRGGAEYGNAWHEAATKIKRQTAYDDFIGAARWLKDEGVASKLAIYGSSNGGLLCGAVCNQVPELIDAALPDVGVMDLLRFHHFTMGSLWQAEYGSPDIEAEFAALRKISPLHNVTTSLDYPATLLTTAEHDSRVIPGHSLKLAATLQQKKADNAHPILARVYTDTGHGMGKTSGQTITEGRDKLAFLALVLGLEVVVPPAVTPAGLNS